MNQIEIDNHHKPTEPSTQTRFIYFDFELDEMSINNIRPCHVDPFNSFVNTPPPSSLSCYNNTNTNSLLTVKQSMMASYSARLCLALNFRFESTVFTRV
ncbi:hypothetical protein HUG17_0013 [Dermatophagoides farinae]|uniref:Uncharacterized protein n=1 Tax=Dermatophagoides farinae TaxID=6954 RepID=A0A9D4P4A2_DERFA|nr:hypothetical protein HUG17_0013 [Dermatophagoides farinae]